MKVTPTQYATICYFDGFDYPLTATELRQWEIRTPVSEDVLSSREVAMTNGMYHLPGREVIVNTRQLRYVHAEKKYTRALRFARMFRLLPSVELIAICNSLALSNARHDSDIDFFIITKPGTIWLTRFWLQTFLRIFRLRPHDHGVSIQDAICLSFFTDATNLDFSDLRISDDDVYLAFWLSHLVVVYDPYGIAKKIWNFNQAWIHNIFPHSTAYIIGPQRRLTATIFSKIFAPLTWSIWEDIARKIQQYLAPPQVRAMANQDTRVVLNDHMLKFHTNDRRELILQTWKSKLQN